MSKRQNGKVDIFRHLLWCSKAMDFFSWLFAAPWASQVQNQLICMDDFTFEKWWGAIILDWKLTWLRLMRVILSISFFSKEPIFFLKKSGSSKSKNLTIPYFPIKISFSWPEIEKLFTILDLLKVFCLANKLKFKLNRKVKVCERNAEMRFTINFKAFFQSNYCFSVWYAKSETGVSGALRKVGGVIL